MKILTIIGARPQFIKAAAVSRIIENYPEITEITVHTGQHFDKNMSDVFFEQMNIKKPDYNLNIHSLSHGAMTGRMLEAIENVIIKEQPEIVMVYGDTNSTIAGSLAAKKLHKKVAHVEAGLRSFNMKMPEEINRILTDRISDYLFCPTKQAVENLKKEGYENFNVRIEQVGDVMYDAIVYYQKFAQKPNFSLPDKFILATVHRAENTDDTERLKNIFEALEIISENLPVVLPLHPRTRQKLKQIDFKPQKTIITEPVGYLQMIYLLNKTQLVITDSGGLQKEAYFMKKPCITLRDETEWVELVEHGFNTLTGADKNKILNAVKQMLNKTLDFSIKLYGNADAAVKIIETLKQDKF